MRPEVIIAGGGPGGSVLATRLAQKGRGALVLERDTFPRFHLGESLLPLSLPVLEEIGALAKVDARFLRKHGANFHDSATGRTARFDFGDAFQPRFRHAYQVPRDEFDHLLLEHAREAGADVRERWSVQRVRFDGTRAVGVDATDPDGKAHTIEAPVFVDATGRSALIAHAHRTTEKVPALDKTALYSHWRGAWRGEGNEAGDIQIVVFGSSMAVGDEATALPPSGWFWFIPFKDGRTSVGAVVGSDWMKVHRGESVAALYQRAIAESPVATRMLAGAEMLWEPQAAADFSFRVRELCGDGWLAVGDSGGFIDPLFSTGAHIAMHGGLEAADAIDRALAGGDTSREKFVAWEQHVRAGAETFLLMVLAFYEGALGPMLFAEKPHPYLRHVVTSMLSGNVFDAEARWLKDARTRFAAVRSGAPASLGG
jgi:flavin-dependent dehydrogenase